MTWTIASDQSKDVLPKQELRKKFFKNPYASGAMSINAGAVEFMKSIQNRVVRPKLNDYFKCLFYLPFILDSYTQLKMSLHRTTILFYK